jgi:serine protease Do
VPNAENRLAESRRSGFFHLDPEPLGRKPIADGVFNMIHPRIVAFTRVSRPSIVAVAVLLVLPLAVRAQGKGSGKILKAFKDVVTKATASTAEVHCDGKLVALGTIVGADGYILTKHSELKGKVTCKLKDGKDCEAKIVGVMDSHDLVLLKIEAKQLPVADWAESKRAPVGNWVASAGIGELPVAVGVVSVATREVPSNLRGTLRAGSGGYLGIGVDGEHEGAKINQIMPKSAAEKAGLKVNDVILKVSGKPVKNLENFLGTLQGHKAGEVVKLLVKRGDKEIDVEATLGKRPAGRSDFQNNMGSELSDRRGGFSHILQHDTVLRARDCGGPLVDLDGKVIGVNIARAGRTETYAIPSEIIRPLLPELMSGKLAPKEDPESLKLARAALDKAEADRVAADKKLQATKATLAKAEAERIAAEKKLTETKAALDKVEAERVATEKKVAEAKAALQKAESEVSKDKK